MIWPIYVILAAALAAASPDKWGRNSLILILAGLFLASSAGEYLQDPLRTLFAASIWLVIGAIVGKESSRTATYAGILLVLAGLFVVPVRLTGASYEIGQPFLVISDLLGLLAILILGRPAINRIARGIRRVCGAFGRRYLGFGVADYQAAQQEISKD